MSHLQRKTESYVIRVTYAGSLGSYGMSAPHDKFSYLNISLLDVQMNGGADPEKYLRSVIREKANEVAAACGTRWTTATNEGILRTSAFRFRSEYVTVPGGVRKFKMMNRFIPAGRAQKKNGAVRPASGA